MSNEVFFRVQMDIQKQQDGTYAKNILQLCWQRPVLNEAGEPIPPFSENGIIDLNLTEYPELDTAISNTTDLATALATTKINTPIPDPEELPVENPV